MTTPNVPHRMELSFEMPGPPEQVWQAIATSNGITSWFLPTDVEERLGGAVVTHMGESESPGTITGWDPPHRLVYEEPGWAALAGHEDADVTPLATEFLVEAQSGGTCVVRVVSSAFGTGADWENEFFEDMEHGWRPYFDRLRLYLTHYAGRKVTVFGVEATLPAPRDAVLDAMRTELGVESPGDRVDLRDMSGVVERISDDDILVHLVAPVAGFLAFIAFGTGDSSTYAAVQGQFFTPSAATFVEREKALWRSWLDGLVVATTP